MFSLEHKILTYSTPVGTCTRVHTAHPLLLSSVHTCKPIGSDMRDLINSKSFFNTVSHCPQSPWLHLVFLNSCFVSGQQHRNVQVGGSTSGQHFSKFNVFKPHKCAWTCGRRGNYKLSKASRAIIYLDILFSTVGDSGVLPVAVRNIKTKNKTKTKIEHWALAGALFG